MINIILITDTWDPEINGVVTTYKNIMKHSPSGYNIDVIQPSIVRNMPEIFKIKNLKYLKITKDDPLTYLDSKRRVQAFQISSILGIPLRCQLNRMYELLDEKTYYYKQKGESIFYHLANEGSLNLQAKRVLDSCDITYTSSYHTKFPEFFLENHGTPIEETKWYFDWFHKNSKYVFSSSYSSTKENDSWNSIPIEVGIGEEYQFSDRKNNEEKTLLFAGRVSKEKNIDDFCKLNIPNTKKIVLGDGPDLIRLKKEYKGVNFLGFKQGKELVEVYQNADVLVFTSKVDTFGMVILEAMSCGTPVAAYDVTGAKDQIVSGVNGYLHSDLSIAVKNCFDIPRYKVYQSVADKTWTKAAQYFVDIVTKP